MLGYIHSIETCGTVDGPGIRFLVFMQGCNLRCLYCHNPDTWKKKSGKIYSADELLNEIVKYKSYFSSSGGGVTITGGDPLMQPEFVLDLLKKCKNEGLHTTLDTSGFRGLENADELLQYTDLILFDLKCIDNKIHKQLTGVSVEPILKFAEKLSAINKPVWVRHVLVPGYTDNDILLERLVQFISGLNNVELCEILPFHKMGEYKWEKMGLDYKLLETEKPSKERIDNAIKIFRKGGLKAR